MAVGNIKRVMITVKTKVLAIEEDPFGYLTYVFEIDKRPIEYLMCTQFPNWDHRPLSLGEEGYLSYQENKAGIDKWFDGNGFRIYNYDTTQFIKFISLPKTNEDKCTI